VEKDKKRKNKKKKPILLIPGKLLLTMIFYSAKEQ
jgi:hypothetical protein